jgi:hypothetical protein
MVLVDHRKHAFRHVFSTVHEVLLPGAAETAQPCSAVTALTSVIAGKRPLVSFP